ncbi:MAG: hypothetical protein AAF412_07020, partial [Pseudomonadota bacterium]
MDDNADELRQQLIETQAQLEASQQEVSELKQQLHRVLYWCNLLSRDIRNVYQSVTWQMGQRATCLILTLLRKKEGTTAGDRIRRVTDEFESWRNHYLQTLDSPTVYVPWHETSETIQSAPIKPGYERRTLESGAIAVYPTSAELVSNALEEIDTVLKTNADIAIVYADEMQLGTGSWFKPDWSPDLFQARNLLSGLVAYRQDIFEAAGGWRDDFGTAAAYDLALRCVSQVDEKQIYHLPKILCHLRQDEDTPAHRDALQAHLQTDAQVTTSSAGYRRVIYPLPDALPGISLIIPTRDRVELLNKAVQGFLEYTDYPELEIVIV